ncbi:MAG: fibronectin type III domain-containing protein, partial [Bacteroidales bacterium]|nr:fibronectin type III domain-containing protein [Bacteroidales bacterium]
SVNPSSGFPTLATEWDVYNQDDVSHLGSHNFAGGGSINYILQNKDVGNTTSYVVTGLDENITYHYVVRAYNICNETSGNSNEISVITIDPTTIYGHATVINNNEDALQNSDIWQRDKENQKMQISIYGGSANTIDKVSIEIPSDFTNISSGNISLSGEGKVSGTSFTFSNNTIEITGAGINNAKPIIISISGLKTPEISNISSTGIYEITVKTKFTNETELTAISNQPKVFVTIPIENVKEYNISTDELLKRDLIVAVEGVSTIESGRLATSSYDQFFIQEGEGATANGLAIHKSTAQFSPALEISKHYIVKGEIKLVRGGANNKTSVKANMTAISNPLNIIDMGEAVLPLPYITSIEQLHSMSDADFEKVDGVLMRIINVTKHSGTWPSNNNSFANIQIKDNEGTNNLRCYIFANTDIGGNPEPIWPANMLTLVYNYDENNNDIGDGATDRQITPVYYDNFYDKIVWCGSTGNKLWSDTRNWSPKILPQEIDQVVFDNITGPNEDYEVLIDIRTVPHVKGVEIKPSSDKKINLILPNTNTNSPALRLVANGSGLVIDNNGTFTNNSGASSGNTVQFHSSGGVYPDFKIKNGGRYVHKTLRSNAYFT